MNPYADAAPQIIMHNGQEFVTAVEACRRMDCSLRTLANRVQEGILKPYRIPGIHGTYGRPPHYFSADQIRKFMS